jgi:hypothetical protein
MEQALTTKRTAKFARKRQRESVGTVNKSEQIHLARPSQAQLPSFAGQSQCCRYSISRNRDRIGRLRGGLEKMGAFIAVSHNPELICGAKLNFWSISMEVRENPATHRRSWWWIDRSCNGIIYEFSSFSFIKSIHQEHFRIS